MVDKADAWFWACIALVAGTVVGVLSAPSTEGTEQCDRYAVVPVSWRTPYFVDVQPDETVCRIDPLLLVEVNHHGAYGEGNDHG